MSGDGIIFLTQMYREIRSVATIKSGDKIITYGRIPIGTYSADIYSDGLCTGHVARSDITETDGRIEIKVDAVDKGAIKRKAVKRKVRRRK